MRDYSIVKPAFWTGRTGREIRAHGSDAVVVALYLMTAPTATMAGLYYLPLPTLSHETGIPLEGASEALQRVEGVGFCRVDRDLDVVWVVEMVRHQIGDSLKPGDNRVKHLANVLEPYTKSCLYGEFYDRYARAYHLDSTPLPKPLRRTLEGPPKPVIRNSEQDQDQEEHTDARARDAAEYLANRIGELQMDGIPDMPRAVHNPPEHLLRDWGVCEAANRYTDEKLRHAVDVKVAQARARNSGQYLNPLFVFSSKSMAYAEATTPEAEMSRRPSTPPPEPAVRRYYVHTGKEVYPEGDQEI